MLFIGYQLPGYLSVLAAMRTVAVFTSQIPEPPCLSVSTSPPSFQKLSVNIQVSKFKVTLALHIHVISLMISSSELSFMKCLCSSFALWDGEIFEIRSLSTQLTLLPVE